MSGKGRAFGASEVRAKEESCVEAEKMRAKRQKGIRVSWNPNSTGKSGCTYRLKPRPKHPHFLPKDPSLIREACSSSTVH